MRPDAPPRIISEPSPIAACGGTGQLVDAPEEPSLAVDPADPRHLLAAWQQDRRPAGASFGIAVAVSRDGGRTWREAMLPELARCAGGPYALVSDVWASIGPDGAAYAGALGVSPNGRPGYAVVVSASRDGGTTWGTPVVVSAGIPTQGIVLDKPSILADPRRAGRVYAVWARYTGGPSHIVDQVDFVRSDDHGATWSAPAPLYAAGSEAQNNELVAPAAGVLLDLFAEGSPLLAGHPARVAAVRSTDGGATWSGPQTVASFTVTQTSDPQLGGSVRATGQDVVAASGHGWAYAAWFENGASGTSAVRVSGSGDGGLTWSPPATVVTEGAQAFLPTLAVAGDGLLGATWYDLRDSAAGPGLGTEVWSGVSTDHGLTWRSRPLGGAFDLRQAPRSTEGLFVGDYEGLAGLPTGFAAAYVEPTASAPLPRTAVYFAEFG